MTGSGGYVAFASFASNLVAGDANNDFDIFLADRVTGAISLVSLSSAGEESDGFSYYPDISDDGRYVVFQSSATNLVADDTNGETDVFLRDVVLGTTTRVSVTSTGGQGNDDSLKPKIPSLGRDVRAQVGEVGRRLLAGLYRSRPRSRPLGERPRGAPR
jgi:hypothetical protein